MNLLSKIALSGKFGKSIYVISGVLTVAMCSLVLLEPVAAAACFFIKLISIPIIFYLFVPFYTTKQEGTGIGLSLSRQIMRMHNGSLVLTRSDSRGTVFTLVFR